jgi:polyferredoxin
VRTRTLFYAGLICVVGAVMLAALASRSTLEINVLHDRNPPYVQLSDGGIRNGYTVKILNKLHEPHAFQLEVVGLAGAQLAILGVEPGSRIRVATDDLRELRVFITLPRAELARLAQPVTSFALMVRDVELGHETLRTTRFQKASAEPARSP